MDVDVDVNVCVPICVCVDTCVSVPQKSRATMRSVRPMPVKLSKVRHSIKFACMRWGLGIAILVPRIGFMPSTSNNWFT